MFFNPSINPFKTVPFYKNALDTTCCVASGYTVAADGLILPPTHRVFYCERSNASRVYQLGKSCPALYSCLRWCREGDYSFPTIQMPTYRIRYAVYRINASDKFEAKKRAIQLMKTNGEQLISVEIATEKSLWKRFVFGA